MNETKKLFPRYEPHGQCRIEGGSEILHYAQLTAKLSVQNDRINDQMLDPRVSFYSSDIFPVADSGDEVLRKQFFRAGNPFRSFR